ncbi:murein L,D-transpeptidase catalytic domain-containing protein [Flavobacterium oncorhynchi]|uniref:murein L,D-transpeptidase catalytic domain-containing protein n=1 Tax=Flavobacterium oncorhynchi TaxID=728056 RepID=UPI003519F6AA
MKIFNLTLFFIVSFFNAPVEYISDKPTVNIEEARLTQQLDEVKALLKNRAGYNDKIVFLVDMKIKSGYNRFFVYDIANNKILDKGLVANGSGSETAVKGDLKFSNEPNSKCTSLGRYSVGKSYKGMFGKAYKLSGLDETNSNAAKRAVVLHSYSAVPNDEQDYYISNSQGCPMVSEVFFKRLEKIIDGSKSNIILHIFY